ncbi:MAG: putative 4-hydroxybenzoate polyprenyltransferase [Desulfotomaculum sp.]|nr:putative 4-hydroxybenzoate polyprenyltransferase [Desulfotomaculum sp.]MCL0081041.1 putative 4-hydroxybenzoate polyprenyltransferase [Peptococcaceae bacterium]
MVSSKMLINKFRVFLEMIKFEHTIFALPFAYTGALLVEQSIPTASNLLWITLAMVSARTAAMSLNRLIDRHIDAKNPRTANRALPKGLLSAMEVWVYVAVSVAILLLATSQLSTLALQLFPVAVAMLVIYPYTKRFTWGCHLFLGATLALAPLGAWIAIAGALAWEPVLLGLAVMFWVAGFDIIYACDDYNFDRQHGIHAIPARFGIKIALIIAVLFHISALVFLLTTGMLLELGTFYFIGVAIAAAILGYEHWLIKPNDLSRSGAAFFTWNGVLSVVMFIFTLLAVI